MLAAAPAAQQCIVIHDNVSGITPADLDGPLPADMRRHVEVFLVAGGKSRVRIDTTAVSGPAETVSLSVSGLRPGIAATFEPQQIVAGESATLVLAGVTGPFRFGAALTVIAESASTSHTAILHARPVEAPRVGPSLPVSVAVNNQGGCGCSARGGGWESVGLLALAAAIRRRRS